MSSVKGSVSAEEVGVGFLFEARRKGDEERVGEVDVKARDNWGIVAGRIRKVAVLF